MKRTVRGIGYLGDGPYVSRLNGIKTKEYLVWYSMLTRCYSDTYHAAKAYKDVFVCDSWHNFQTFAKWFTDNYIEGYQLDKDTKILGNKIYSPATCCFVSKKENVTMRNTQGREYTLISPEGMEVNFNSIKDFCETNNLDRGTVSKLLRSKANSHKGWTL